MAQNDMLKRYLDAGIAFTQMTRAKAEEIVKDLVKRGDISANVAMWPGDIVIIPQSWF